MKDLDIDIRQHFGTPDNLCTLPKRRYSLDEEKLECALGNRDIWFLARQENRECCIFISDVEIRGIYLSLALGTVKFKQLEINHVLCIHSPGFRNFSGDAKISFYLRSSRSFIFFQIQYFVCFKSEGKTMLDQIDQSRNLGTINSHSQDKIPREKTSVIKSGSGSERIFWGNL